jgi:hypothetical protein
MMNREFSFIIQQSSFIIGFPRDSFLEIDRMINGAGVVAGARR